MNTCRACHRPIVWAKTRAGKSIPLDSDLAEARELLRLDAEREPYCAHCGEADAIKVATALAERERKVWLAVKRVAEHGGFAIDNAGEMYRTGLGPADVPTAAVALKDILKAAWEATKP